MRSRVIQLTRMSRPSPRPPIYGLRRPASTTRQSPSQSQHLRDCRSRCYNIEGPNLPSIMNTTLVVRYHEGFEPLVPKYHSICRISTTTTTRANWRGNRPHSRRKPERDKPRKASPRRMHAAGVYDQARRNAVGYVPAPPGYAPPPPGHPLPPLQRGQVIPGVPVVGPPPPPAFAVGAMNALALRN